MNKITNTLVARVGPTTIVNFLTTDSAIQLFGWKRICERDTVLVTTYSYDIGEIDTIFMDNKNTSSADISGDIFFFHTTNIAG